METSFTVFGIKTGIIRPGDNIVEYLLKGIARSPAKDLSDGDIIVVAESALATAEGRIVDLPTVNPSDRAKEMGKTYQMDPRVVEIILEESDEVLGGIAGFLLCMKNGTLLPNAGVDASNAPPDSVVLLPKDPVASASRIRQDIMARCGVRISVIVADSRVHAMRLGCTGVALGCAGMTPVIDDRGRNDLFGKRMKVTKRALADNLASAAEVVMGECDEMTPFAIIRGLDLPVSETSILEVIHPDDCLFMGVFRKTPSS